jgi:predicted metal-dependent hydrolase
MPVLTVGSTEIPYTVRFSKRAERISIRVTPELVEAVAPENFSEDRVDAFVRKKRQWIYSKVEGIAEQEEKSRFRWPDRFVTGAKIPFHGRNMRLRVTTKDIKSIKIQYRNGFLVEKPINASDSDVRAALEKWLGFRLKDEVRYLVEHYAPTLNVRPGSVTISTLKTRWGSCGKNGDIRINWLLSIAPKPVLEYVLIHELCHLRYRNHSSEFWSLVASYLPDFQAQKSWLEENSRFMSV